MAGMKVRTTNSPIEIADFEAFGALPTAIAWAEVYTSLQQKVVDGEGNAYDLLWPTKHWEHLKYGTENSYNYSFDVTVMNLKSFNELPKDVQELITASGREATDWQRQNAQQSYDTARENFQKQGIQIHTPTDEEFRQWRQAAKPVWDRFIQPGKAEPDFVDLILKTLGKTRDGIFK
jgi:TRAP-type C4-dicarboxylate transport system substrate-binding protein